MVRGRSLWTGFGFLTAKIWLKTANLQIFMTNRIFGSGKKEEYVMLTQEQKETMIAALRGKSVAKENITEEYKKNVRKK